MKLAVAIAIDEVALRARVERALAGWLQARPATLEVVLTDATGLREAPRPGPGRELVLLCEQDGRRPALELLARSRVHHLVPIDDGLEAWLAILMRRLARSALCTGVGAQLGAAEVTRRSLGSADDKGRALQELGVLASQVLRHAMLGDLLVARVDLPRLLGHVRKHLLGEPGHRSRVQGTQVLGLECVQIEHVLIVECRPLQRHRTFSDCLACGSHPRDGLELLLSLIHISEPTRPY